MRQSQPVVLRECAGSIEAETIRIRLNVADIRAIVTGTDSATALGLGGAGTMRLVRVEVGAEDYDRACELLDADQRRLQQVGPWICSRCGEQNEAAFELCWSCTKPRSDDDQQGRVDQHSAPNAAFAPPISVRRMLSDLKACVYRDQRLRRRVIVALCINLAAILAWLLYWRVHSQQ